MSQALGRVTTDLEVPRGPDAEHRVTIASAWLREGATIEVELPRKLVCSACTGGGCDRCERSGAVRVALEDEAPARVRLVLPIREPELGEFAIRLPHQGGLATDPRAPRGHLLLVISSLDAPTPGSSVLRIEAPSEPSTRDLERQRLMKRSLIMAVCLILTFVGLLRLSGWI